MLPTIHENRFDGWRIINFSVISVHFQNLDFAVIKFETIAWFSEILTTALFDKSGPSFDNFEEYKVPMVDVWSRYLCCAKTQQIASVLGVWVTVDTYLSSFVRGRIGCFVSFDIHGCPKPETFV